MKKYIFSSLLVLCGMTPALASDCTGAGCDIEPITFEEFESAYVAPTPIAEYEQPVEYIYATPIPMRSVKMLSIKPVPEDTRPALWDGTHGNYKQRAYTKTVSWRDGAPVWDDSVANYRDTDYSDWYLEPLPEIYMREADAPIYSESISITDMYNQNMADAAATRARIDEILAPKRPQFDLWSEHYTPQDMTEIVETVLLWTMVARLIAKPNVKFGVANQSFVKLFPRAARVYAVKLSMRSSVLQSAILTSVQPNRYRRHC